MTVICAAPGRIGRLARIRRKRCHPSLPWSGSFVGIHSRHGALSDRNSSSLRAHVSTEVLTLHISNSLLRGIRKVSDCYVCINGCDIPVPYACSIDVFCSEKNRIRNIYLTEEFVFKISDLAVIKFDSGMARRNKQNCLCFSMPCIFPFHSFIGSLDSSLVHNLISELVGTGMGARIALKQKYIGP